MFAKVNQTQVVQYPYTRADLLAENPDSHYDGRFTLPEWYAKTDAAQDGSEVVEIVEGPMPADIDWDTEMADLAETPQLVSGTWQFTWTKRNKTAEELANTNLPVAET